MFSFKRVGYDGTRAGRGVRHGQVPVTRPGAGPQVPSLSRASGTGAGPIPRGSPRRQMGVTIQGTTTSGTAPGLHPGAATHPLAHDTKSRMTIPAIGTLTL